MRFYQRADVAFIGHWGISIPPTQLIVLACSVIESRVGLGGDGGLVGDGDSSDSAYAVDIHVEFHVYVIAPPPSPSASRRGMLLSELRPPRRDGDKNSRGETIQGGGLKGELFNRNPLSLDQYMLPSNKCGELFGSSVAHYNRAFPPRPAESTSMGVIQATIISKYSPIVGHIHTAHYARVRRFRAHRVGTACAFRLIVAPLPAGGGGTCTHVVDSDAGAALVPPLCSWPPGAWLRGWSSKPPASC